MAAAATPAVFDMTDVKDGGGQFNTKRQPEGDYKAKVTAVADAPSKKDGVAQWVFTIQVGAGSYPYYCKHEQNQYWKLRNLLVAAGMNVPKKKVKVDPNKVVGKYIGVTLEDEEYQGKQKSIVAATFPVNELNEDVPDEDEADEIDDENEDEAPAPKAKKPAPVVEDDDEDEDEDDTPPPPKKKKPAPVVEDDDEDLEEIDIDDE